MLRRTTSAVFAGGMYVFPGGKVDAADRGPGSSRTATGSTMRRHRPRWGWSRVDWRTSWRQCASASRRPASCSPGAPTAVRRRPDEADRHAVHAGELSMVELCRRARVGARADRRALRRPLGDAGRGDPAGSTPGSSSPSPRPTSRARTTTPRRCTACGSGPPMRWARPAGELRMMPPTIANLAAIAGCATTDEVLALVDAAGRPPRIEPTHAPRCRRPDRRRRHAHRPRLRRADLMASLAPKTPLTRPGPGKAGLGCHARCVTNAREPA